MANSRDQSEKLSQLMGQADELRIDGLFTDDGLSAEEMAQKLWKLGYLEKPSVDELLSAMEREIEKKRAAKQRNQEDFIRLWTAAGVASNYNKAAWLDVERQLFNAGII